MYLTEAERNGQQVLERAVGTVLPESDKVKFSRALNNVLTPDQILKLYEVIGFLEDKEVAEQSADLNFINGQLGFAEVCQAAEISDELAGTLLRALAGEVEITFRPLMHH